MSQNPLPGDGNPAPSYSQEYAALQQRALELEQYQQQTQEFLERLSPIAPHVKRLLEDEDARRVYDDSIHAYDSVRERQKPRLSDEWNPEVNPWLKKIDQVSEAVSKFSERAEQYERSEKERVNQELLHQNARVAENLIKQYPHLAENGHAGIRSIALESMHSNISFEEAARRLEPVYKAQSRQAIDEPTLRSGSGLQGVPGPSDSDKAGNLKDRFLEIMKSGTR